MKLLPQNAYRQPEIYQTTMTKKDLAELLLESEGFIMACGHVYNIMSKALGAGIHKVWLKEKVYK